MDLNMADPSRGKAPNATLLSAARAQSVQNSSGPAAVGNVELDCLCTQAP